MFLVTGCSFYWKWKQLWILSAKKRPSPLAGRSKGSLGAGMCRSGDAGRRGGARGGEGRGSVAKPEGHDSAKPEASVVLWTPRTSPASPPPTRPPWPSPPLAPPPLASVLKSHFTSAFFRCATKESDRWGAVWCKTRTWPRVGDTHKTEVL